MLISDDRLRAMYQGGRGDTTARRFARLWAAVFRLGLAPKRWVTLEVAGRRSGQVTRLARRAGRAGRAGRRHHWWRWAIASVAALVVLVVLGAGIFIKLQPAPAPLALPTGAPSAAAGPLDGTWVAGGGSVAGFRVQESAFGMSNDTVGRTSAVTGAIVISGDRVTSGAFRIGLISMKVGGKVQPQFAKSLGTSKDPVATITLIRPVTLNAAFASGATVTERVTGRLAMHGISRPVVVTVSGRRDGSSLLVAGSIPVVFSRWNIRGPQSFGFIASLASSGIAEFLLILHRR
jgi:polyisoprenoid-binding protein YceI